MPVDTPLLSYEEATKLVDYVPGAPPKARITLATARKMVETQGLQPLQGSYYKICMMENQPRKYFHPVEFRFNSIGSTVFIVDLAQERRDADSKKSNDCIVPPDGTQQPSGGSD
jgi:hypothetical protein